MNYDQFLEAKKNRVIESGFDPGELPDFLFPFQKFCVRRALIAGKYSLFEDCGLGKTRQQIVFADQCNKKTGMPSLILCPLSVSGQTIQEGQKIGIQVMRAKFWPDESIQIANYEQLDDIDSSKYGCVVLDESSILKNFEGVYRNLIIEKFKHTPYKLCCTATPSPNDPMELGNHAEFLDVMTRNEMLAMYFVHDGGETAKWRLKKHSVKLFWQWVSSWSMVFSDPKDIGFKMDGYQLPELNFVENQVITDKRDNGLLFNDVAVSATNFNTELRLTKIERLDKVKGIIDSSDERFIIWVKQNEEADMLKEMFPDAIEVRGSDLWQKYASPVWMDIDYGNTLNGRPGRDEKDEKHIAPLQLDTIERCIHLWSNEGDTVLSPFAGIGSELFKSIQLKRKAIGFELKESYFNLNVKNCKDAEAGLNVLTLFP